MNLIRCVTVGEQSLRRIKITALLWLRFFWRQKGLWLRALLCWFIGLAFVFADIDQDHDLRLFVRGQQKIDPQILIVNLDFNSWSQSNLSPNDQWNEILKKIISQHPRAVGAIPTPNELYRPELGPITQGSSLAHPRVIWADNEEKPNSRLQSKVANLHNNIALHRYIIDPDGFVRRFDTSQTDHHFAVQLAKYFTEPKVSRKEPHRSSLHMINFRGPPGTFTQINYSDVKLGRFPKNFFRDKIVIVGSPDINNQYYRTPVGLMAPTELAANIVDNLSNQRWIRPINWVLTSLLLALFVIFVAALTTMYPQYLASFIIFWTNLIYGTISLWLFDSFYIWTPILSIAIISFVTYVTFLSFQLTLKEYLTIQLEKEREFLLDVEQLKNNFLSLISHDLKTPIAKIQAICDRIIAENSNITIHPDLNSLKDVAAELHRYIQTLLQIARVESRDFRVHKEATDINELVESVARQLEPLAKHKHITIEYELEPMFLVEMDPILIREVILNLIENAIKYSPESGHIKVSSCEVDDRVLVMVEDNGPGIPLNEQSRIFEKFFRGQSGKSQSKGSGLGLYLVKYFVELHGGRVFLTSTPGIGTKFAFSMPVMDESANSSVKEKNPYEADA